MFIVFVETSDGTFTLSGLRNLQSLPNNQSEEQGVPVFAKESGEVIVKKSLFYFETRKGDCRPRRTACAVKARLTEGDELKRYLLTGRPGSPLVEAHIATRCDRKKSCAVQETSHDFSPSLCFFQPFHLRVVSKALKYYLSLKSPSFISAQTIHAYAYDYHNNKLITLTFNFNGSEYVSGDRSFPDYAVGAPIVQKDGGEMFVVGVLGLTTNGKWRPELFVKSPTGELSIHFIAILCPCCTTSSGRKPLRAALTRT